MRLLAPAVFLAIGGLVSPASESAASSFPSSPPKHGTVSIQSETSRDKDSAAALPGRASQMTSQTASLSSGTGAITIPPRTRVTLALTSPIWAKTAKA
ncbi:MAG TPA: hypothetical protein VNB49_02865, partial [Candidatus Dormibacteraeota bacterium]|nr:hypothetical protein [Candidatus Dormibacteraeota bacterium]